MTDEELVNNFSDTLDTWAQKLNRYTPGQLLVKPAENSWSIGQVYMHIISATEYFMLQVKTCASNNDNCGEDSSASAKRMFLNNDFPDAILEGPPGNAFTPQPASKEDVLTRLAALEEDINNAGAIMLSNVFNGKTKHPGLHYFTAREWFQFAEMHVRHHERQIRRIEQFLKEKSVA
ncbi:MAG TPA: DinB family protein [Chitinophagaceae bacterium]|nr:DinB family protein [Chitinophagaceae bacterium]